MVKVYAQRAEGSMQQLLDANYSGPVFQDAFWTNRTNPIPEGTSLDKIEVGPGDGSSVLAVVLVNRGLSEITSVTGILDLPSGFSGATGATQAAAKQNSIVKPGQTFTLFFEVKVSDETEVTGYNAQLHVQYSRVLEVGQYRNADIIVPFRLTGKVVIDAEAVNREIVPGSANEVTIRISNRGTAPATGVVATVSASGPPSSDGTNGGTLSAVTVGQKTFDIGTIPANDTREIHPVIYASKSEAPQSVNLQVSYGNTYGVKTSTVIQVGLVSLSRALESDIAVARSGSLSTILTAGKIYPYNFTLSNISGRPLSDMLITLASGSDSIKILGDSKWTVRTMDSNYSKTFNTQVFAPTSLIGESTTFNLILQYLSEGQTKTDFASLGAYIDGEITIRAHEIDVMYIGDIPNIVGNLLNEGNTNALFTTIQVTNTSGLTTSFSPPQYLGDLEENSPLPFSIPVDINGKSGAGVYPVSLKITYKDSLRETHTFDINSQVKFEPKQITTQSESPTINYVIPLGIGVAVVAIMIIVVLFRRKKRSIIKRTITERKQNEIESLLDSQHLKTDEHK